MSVAVLSEGRALCVWEPRGYKGLEGYDEGLSYRYQECRGEIRGAGVIRYFRVYPGSSKQEWDASPDYYEICRPALFARAFRAEGVAGPSGREED